MVIALSWCSDEGGCNEVSPYDHFQTMVRLGGGEWPLLVQIRPVSPVCSLFCGLHLTFWIVGQEEVCSFFLLFFLFHLLFLFLFHFSLLFFLFLFPQVRAKSQDFSQLEGIESQWFQRIASSLLFTSILKGSVAPLINQPIIYWYLFEHRFCEFSPVPGLLDMPLAPSKHLQSH